LARSVPSSRQDADLVVDVSHDIEPFLLRCAALVDPLSIPFHAVAWLRAWYATLGAAGGRQPVLVGVRSARTGADLLLLPLTSRRAGGLSIIEFADASVVDYQLPLHAPSAADTFAAPAEAKRLWRAVRAALAGHDLLRIDKMLTRTLAETGSRPNLLMQVMRSADCEMYGNESHAPGTWDEWRHSLGKHGRKEFERAWRVFTRSPQARFERVTDLADALTVFEQLEAQQAERMHAQGTAYVLDQPAFRAFYRQALIAGLADGTVVLTALRDGEHLVAALYGIANHARFIALRLSTGGDAWAACSPGRLLLERTACHLHAQGVHWFDFGIGGYSHKAFFKVRSIPLFDAVDALSWRGLPLAWAWRARRALKRQIWLVRVVRRLRKHDGVHAPR
jgi:CelD/BcsL family acetyltransferase involved in cellulose biosynthesis